MFGWIPLHILMRPDRVWSIKAYMLCILEKQGNRKVRGHIKNCATPPVEKKKLLIYAENSMTHEYCGKHSADWKCVILTSHSYENFSFRWLWDYTLQITATVPQKLFKRICCQVSSLESLWTLMVLLPNHLWLNKQHHLLINILLRQK